MFYKKFLRPLLFKHNPEFIHELTLQILSKTGGLIPRNPLNDHSSLGVSIAGLYFPNRIGLAAGLDKAGIATLAWQGFGFGFMEIGTITDLVQRGNPKPRLFRLQNEESLLNRLGFNNPGANSSAAHLNNLRQRNQLQIPLGINIGKSFAVPAQDQEQVIEDYRKTMHKLQIYADYLTVNVSSPNTPGLRLWENPQQLKKFSLAAKTA